MNKQTDDRKINKGEVTNDDKTELTDEALEQVDGGYGKNCYYSYSEDRSASYTSSSGEKRSD